MSQTEVLMPSMGEGVMEATLVRWIKNKGDKIDADEPLVEISTDKVDTEIPSPASGFIIDVLAKEGDTVAVDQVLAVLSSEQNAARQQEGGAAATPAAAPSAPSAPSAPAAAAAAAQPPQEPTPAAPAAASSKAAAAATDTRPARKIKNQLADHTTSRSSPLVRKIAKEKGIDLREVTGTGIHGRITKNDLEIYLKETSIKATTRKIPGSHKRPKAAEITAKAPIKESAPKGALAPIEEQSLTTTFEGESEFLEGVKVQREKMSKMRTLISEHMVQSVRVSPHVTTVFEVNLHKVAKIREKEREAFLAQEGFKLTYTPFLIHAAILALKKFPIVNASIDGNDILFKKDINVGCAVAIEGGLIVPVIKRASQLNLNGIASRLNDLVTKARSKKLSPDDVKGGTFTVTNPGGYGSITSNPIINQPQLAILGVGAIVKKPVVIEDDAICVRPMMMISLTFDHRAIDGETGAKFLAHMKETLENYEHSPL